MMILKPSDKKASSNFRGHLPTLGLQYFQPTRLDSRPGPHLLVEWKKLSQQSQIFLFFPMCTGNAFIDRVGQSHTHKYKTMKDTDLQHGPIVSFSIVCPNLLMTLLRGSCGGLRERPLLLASHTSAQRPAWKPSLSSKQHPHTWLLAEGKSEFKMWSWSQMSHCQLKWH